MTDLTKCHQCTWDFGRGWYCTGRPGCVRASHDQLMRQMDEAEKHLPEMVDEFLTEQMVELQANRAIEVIGKMAEIIQPAVGTEGGADIVERLLSGRCSAGQTWEPNVCELPPEDCPCAIDKDAADEIARLRAEVERLTATVAGLNETLDAANDMMADAPTDAVRRVRSGEAAAYMGPEVVILSRAQHDSDHEVVIRLRAEVERWKERAHLAEGAVAVLNSTIDDLNGEVDRLTAERDEARHWQQVGDREDEWTPLVKAAHPSVTGKNHDEYATALRMIHTRRNKGSLVSLVSWLLSDRHARDIAVVKAALEAAVDVTTEYHVGPILDIDPAAVIKAMEEGR